MLTLPIDALQGEFAQTLQKQKAIVVTAPTGSGKSTRLPLWMAEQLDGPILVLEPRRVACRSLASFLAEQRQETCGESIGYRIRFEDKSSKETQVLFVTPGVALRMLQRPSSAKDATIQIAGKPIAGVLIDEFHERGWETDLAAALLRQRMDEGHFSGKLVLTSATIEAEMLADKLDAALLNASGRTYPVDIFYREEPAMPTQRHLDRRVLEALQSLPKTSLQQGDILVFLPGKREIRQCTETLSGFAQKHDFALVPVHGSIPTDRLARALGNSKASRIFLSTNVAETSLTLPGVTTVIDSGLARIRMHRSGRSLLALSPISKASMDQRAGRAGRVAAGRCIRLWSQRFRPATTTAPEVERIELDDLLLTSAACALHSDAYWISQPPEFAWNSAKERLTALDAIDEKGLITPLGQGLFRLPVSAHEARLLTQPPPELAATLADLVALLQNRGDLLKPIYNLPQAQKERVMDARKALFKGHFNEVYIQLKSLRLGHPREHALHATTLAETRRIARHLRELLGVRPASPNNDQTPLPSPKELTMHLLKCWPEAAFVLRMRAQKTKGKPSRKRSSGPQSEPWGNGKEELHVMPYTIPYECDDEPSKPRAGVILDHEWIGELGTSFRGVGRMLLPCSVQALYKAGLGEEAVQEPTLQENEDGSVQVVGRVQWKRAGIVLHADTIPLTGKALHQATASLLLEDRLLRGAKELILEDLHLWELLHQHAVTTPGQKASSKPFESPQGYLEALLLELGVEQSDDLALLETDDLRPDLAAHFGLQAFELDEWRKDFPRCWNYQGSVFLCRVQYARRRVILEPLNKTAKKAPVPGAGVVPRFKGFKVEYLKASRQVTIRG